MKILIWQRLVQPESCPKDIPSLRGLGRSQKTGGGVTGSQADNKKADGDTNPKGQYSA